MIKALRYAFPKTIPVMAGYIFLGTAYGLLMHDAGFGILWTVACSFFVYSGTAQFLGVSLLSVGAPLIQVALLTFILSFRHFFYGFSMINRYPKKGLMKGYLIHTLSDETYALIVGNEEPRNIDKGCYYFAVSFLDQMYWILGSVIGVTVGSLIKIDLTGIDFAMTALFAVLVVEQWKSKKCHIPAVIGALVSVVLLVILGPDMFLIPTLVIVTILLIVFRKTISERENGGADNVS